MRRQYLKQHMGLGQFEWIDSFGDDSLDVLDLGDSFDYGALDFGSDISLDDYGGWGVDDYAVDYGSGAFEDWGSADWGSDLFSAEGASDLYGDEGFDWSFADEDYGTFDLGGETLSVDDWGALSNPWTEEMQWGDDPFGTDALDLGGPATADGSVFSGGDFSLPWDKLIGAGVSIGTTLLTLDAQKTAAENRQPTVKYVQPTPTKTVLPSVTTPTFVESRDPTTGQRILIDPRTGGTVPSTIDRSTGRLVPTGPATQPGIGTKISSFVKANPIPVIAGIALLGFVLLPESTPKGK